MRLPSFPYFSLKSLFSLSIPFKFSANLCFPFLIPAPHPVRNMVNQKVSKQGYYCTVQWDRTCVSNTRLIFFVEKLAHWNTRKQNKWSPNKLTVYTSTIKFLTTETGAAQNPAEWVRLGRVRAAEVQKLSLFNTLPCHYTCQLQWLAKVPRVFLCSEKWYVPNY